MKLTRFKIKRLKFNNKTMSIKLDILDASKLSRKIQIAKEFKKKGVTLKIELPSYDYDVHDKINAVLVSE